MIRMPMLLFLALGTQAPPAGPPTAPSTPGAVASFQPTIEWSDLPPELPQSLRDSVRFGYLAVPRDHAEPNGPRLRIAIAVLPARSASRLPDPVVSIAGGPGLPAIEFHMRLRSAGPHPLDVFRERRDLVIIDTRGHGFSGPRRCSELDGAGPLTDQSTAAERIWLAKLAACRDRLVATAVRLETLSSVQAAHDLELLRRALGAPQLNLIGLSYGSRIAAEALRQVPSSIRAVYFSGPVPAGHFGDSDASGRADEVLEVLFRRCATQPACRAAYPRLEADYDTVMSRLRRSPVRVPVPRSDAAPEGEVVVDEDLMQRGFAEILLNRKLAAGAPLLIHTLATQGLGPLGSMAPQLMEAIGGGGVTVAEGTFLAFWCNDGRVNSTSSELLQQRCRTWLGETYTGRCAEPVRSDVPGLIETGEFDPRTPPSFARFLAAGLPRAHLLILPWYGHERPPDCSLRISRDFFDAPDDAPDTTCVDSIPPIEFVTGVAPSRWVGTAVGRASSRPWLVSLPGAAGLLLLGSAIGIPMHGLRARRRSRGYGDARASLSLLLVAAVGLTFLLGLAAAVFVGMRRHFFIPLIGVPQGWAWLLALPWLLLVLTPVAGILALSGPSRHAAGPTVLRWTTLVGAALLLALWAYSVIA
jgi:pimeloyl-ACP methyl ester carboxylesterase